MVTPRATVRARATESFGQPAILSERTSRSDRQPRCAPPLSRHYEVAFLTPLGDIDSFSRMAPATPDFEDAFAALARGTLIATEFGQTAVEDLLPGTLVHTSSDEMVPALWIGSTTLMPGGSDIAGGDELRLTRVASDTFGVGRPMPDLMLGPRARLLYRSIRCRDLLGSSSAFAPAHGFVDGDNVIEVTPFAPVRVFQIALDGQHAILANGMEVESFHPGPQIEALLDTASAEQFLALFPHVDGFDRFGPMRIPRLTAFELDTLRSG